jgi:phosphoglycolate phosphatase-like HAD superfamily hydrolase
MTGIIFDLDGTLIDSYDLDEKLYREAVVSEVPGVLFRRSWHDYRHSTDSGILSEILEELELDTGDHYDAVRRRFGELMTKHLQSSNHCAPIAGAAELLHGLRQTSDIRIGIATGGWRHTAVMKLQAAGLWDPGIPMSTADDAHSRTDIMRICAGKMDASVSDFVYVGDALWDMKAARELGWRFIGIGNRLTGKCESWVPHLCDVAGFIELSCP